MRILITGINGFLARHLDVKLISKGHEVYGCDLTHSGNENHFRCDIRDFANLYELFVQIKPELVYNLAGEFGRLNGDIYSHDLWTTNCLGLRYVEKLCARFNSYLVHASSSEAYGDLPIPQSEDDLCTKVPRFANEYALTKWTNEKQLEIAAQDGLRYSVVRFFNVYGPGELYSPYRSVVCLFIYRLLHNLPITVYTGYKRVFLYIDDWAETMSRFAGEHNPGIYNIGGEQVYPIEDLKDKILSIIGRSGSEITYLPHEQANVVWKLPDMERTKRELLHKVTVDLDEGLKRTVEWMRAVYP